MLKTVFVGAGGLAATGESGRAAVGVIRPVPALLAGRARLVATTARAAGVAAARSASTTGDPAAGIAASGRSTAGFAAAAAAASTPAAGRRGE